MTRHLRIYDHFAIPHLSNTATAWRMPPQHPPGSEGSRRDGCGTRGQNRCPGAAAGPGRASRSITPSRRLACGDLAGGPPPTGTWTKQLGLQRVPHAGRLFRTRAACPVHGRGCPDSEQQAHVRMRRPRLHIASLRALQRAWCRAAPLLSHAGRLSRTRAACPVHGRGCPDSEQQAHVRMRRPRLEIAGLRALQRAWCRAVPLLSHAGRLSRTRAAYSARGPPVPHAGGVAQTRNSRPTCG